MRISNGNSSSFQPNRSMTEIFKIGRLTVVVSRDPEPPYPRTEFYNVGTFVCFHSRYKLGDVNPDCSPTEYMYKLMSDREHGKRGRWIPEEIADEHLKKYINKHFFALPVYLFDHGGLSVSTSPFTCRWDSGQVGFIYVDRDSKDYPDPLFGLRTEIQILDQYLTGDVYGYDVEDEDGNVIDSCWGIFGFEECKKEATLAATNLASVPVFNFCI